MTPFYDPMIAKVIVHAPTRAQALAALDQALGEAVIIGPKTNLAFLRALLSSPEVVSGAFDTGLIDANLARLGAEPRAADARAVLAGARLLLVRPDATRASPLAPADPWGKRDSFELMGARRVGVDVVVDGRPERLHLVEAGTSPDADAARGLEPGEAPKITLHEAAGGVFAFSGGRQAFIALADPLARAAGGADEGDGAIRAPMNGRVAALHVAEGEAIEAGQRLAVVEAMKMEHALTAPFAGLVRDLAANVGDQVEMGERIMRVEAEAA